MATWKKIITSGSAAQLGSLTLTTDLAVTQGGTGADSPAGAATSLGVGTGNSPQFTAVNIGHATDTTIGRASAGDIKVQENIVYRAGGTNVAIADGGTNANDAPTAATNLGVGALSTVVHGSIEAATGNISGSSTSTGSFGKLLGDGGSLSNLPSGYTVENSANDRILTSLNSTSANAESTLTFSTSTGVLENTAGVGSKISGSIHSTGSFGHVSASTYSGDGSGLSGIEIDVDTLSELTVTPANGDNLLVSDNGDSKKITWSRVRDGVYASLSSHAQVAAGGVVTIQPGVIDSGMYADASIDYEHIQNVAANSLLGRNANSPGVVSAIALADTQIMIGDGTGFTPAVLSGDVTMTNAGAVTIGPSKITAGMVNTNFISAQATNMTGDVADADELLISDNGVISRTAFSVFRDAVFNDASGDVEIAAGGVATIQSDSVEGTMLNDNVADDSTIEVSSNTLSVLKVPGALTTGPALEFVGGSGPQSYDGASAKELSVSDNGITKELIADNVAGTGLTNTASDGLKVNFLELHNESPQFLNLTISGDLTVQGETTTIDTQNLLVEDNFIFTATGSAAINIDGGFIVQSGSSDLTGSAIYHDISEQRWALGKGVISSGSNSHPPASFVTTVSASVGHDPASTEGAYGVGEMWVTTSDEIWIRTS
jgi:hypothetical protein